MPQDDFDFLFGSWHVAHRRLRKRLAACTDWDAFGGTSRASPLLGGLANFDDNRLELPPSSGGAYRAVTLRAFDATHDQWSIWWLDGRYPDRLDVPMVGRFDADGTGTFHADDVFEGRPIRVRFLWSHTRTPSPRWEQAFSLDRGATWETNWEMAFSRTGVIAAATGRGSQLDAGAIAAMSC
jgi:hypothetical protein